MDNFVVSARKYRPSTFKQVVGQESITSTLQSAIKNNHLAQAFLFTGPRGVGKTTCARILAKTINCLNPTPDMEPCNECESCTAFNNNASLNIYELDAASNNSVEDIRTLVEQVRIPPQSGKYKVYIIDEVHMLSTAAFNAFLKTLEEPPEYAKFILATTEKHKILPTILSRCQIFDFKRIGVEDIANHLAWVAENEGIEADKEALHVIAQKADGALRDALSTFDQIASYAGNKITYKDVIENLNILDYEYYFKVVDFILNGDTPGLLLIFNEILENGFDGQHFLTGLSEHFRQLLVVKDVETLKLLEAGPALKEKYKKQSEKCNPAFILKALDITGKFDMTYKTSNNKRLHVEMALIKLSSMQWKDKEPVVKKEVKGNVNKEVKKTVTSDNPRHKINKSPSDNIQRQNTVSVKKANGSEVKNTEKPVDTNKVNENTVTYEKNKNISQHPVKEKRQDEVERKSGFADVRAKMKEEDAKRKLGNISIKSAINKLKKKEEDNKEEEVETVNEFSQDELSRVWRKFVEGYKETSPSFSFAVGKYEPELKENFKINIKLDSPHIANDLINMTALLEFLKKELKNTKIELVPVLPEKQERKNVPTDRERFNELLLKYPGLQELKEKLNLELDI